MAKLDPRLLPVVEILTELGMDWLVQELIEAIRRGDEPPEDEHALALARKQVGQAPPDEITLHTSADSETPPFLSDDQLQWAAKYVFDRLSATLAEMFYSLDALNQIVEDAEGKQPTTSRTEPVLVLFDGDEERTVRRAQVAIAQDRLPELRTALDAWRRSALSEPRSD